VKPLPQQSPAAALADAAARADLWERENPVTSPFIPNSGRYFTRAVRDTNTKLVHPSIVAAAKATGVHKQAVWWSANHPEQRGRFEYADRAECRPRKRGAL
jgi:hypothetical protein